MNKIQIPIGNLSDILNIHPRTLRIYDKEKILTPKRNSKNRRYYTTEDIQKAEFIKFLTRNLSINLMGVKFILKMLEKNNIKKDYLKYAKQIAQELDINETENIKKNLKKGRKRVV